MAYGTFYRSDTREPSEIFVHGFNKRDNSYHNPALRAFGGEVAPDIEPNSAVCFSRHFEASALFPVGDLNANSFIYAFVINTSNVFNTQNSQWNHAQQRSFAAPDLNLWPMFGQERASNSIPASSIIGCVAVERNPNGQNFWAGLQFRPNLGKMNPNYTGSEQYQKIFIDLVTNILNTWIQTPSTASGFGPSTGQ